MNVLHDPWIPVRTQNNRHIRVTLPDFYAHAHEYQRLETENAFDEFSHSSRIAPISRKMMKRLKKLQRMGHSRWNPSTITSHSARARV